MSHFTVAVITDDLDKLEKLLAPYQENNMGDCPREYMEFNDVEEENRKSYETDTVTRVKLEDGKLVKETDSRFAVQDNRDPWPTTRYVVPEHLERIEISIKEEYPTFEEYIENYVGYSKDPEIGKYGYWENPNAKWDWWTLGGRWSDSLLLKTGSRADVAQIKDIFFIQEAIVPTGLSVEIEGFHVPASLAPTFQLAASEASQEWGTVISGQGFYKPEYYLKRFRDKETFINESLSFSTYAVITPDGVWHAKGEMGWFGMSSESPEEAQEFSNSYFDTFIKNANPEHYLAVVDCHI
ncbi:hypothetical protein J1TS5_03440 [Paenibacillus macerans]|uniref:hypothetical protein n=1 Tax=Paenibacillus macerans TaxID=44252 RepID=UPI001B16B103|nr:hypothetical protein [Paenibacillus macerans]GIP08174.1 hypothetical protein J1TS5_03440 [Paenibacillus macerans]